MVDALEAAVDGIAKDTRILLGEHPLGAAMVAMVYLLPVAAAVVYTRTRSIVVAWTFACATLLFVLWGAYYAADDFAKVGGAAWAPTFVLVLAGWTVVVVAARRDGRRRRVGK